MDSYQIRLAVRFRSACELTSDRFFFSLESLLDWPPRPISLGGRFFEGRAIVKRATLKQSIFFSVILIWVGLQSAQARPRDDVMRTLYACNTLPDDRQWLDCYYGAAQPVRDALGLKPALPDQIRLAQLPSTASAVQPSSVRSTVITSAGSCYGAPGEGAWLDCYYAAAKPMREHLGLDAPATDIASLDARQVQFGLQKTPGDVGARQIVSRMVSYSFAAHNIFTVNLANGQTWRQIEGDTDAARWSKPAATYLVTIRRGLSGSFILSVRNEPHSFRVRRVN